MVHLPSVVIISVGAQVVACPCGDRATITQICAAWSILELKVSFAKECADKDGRTVMPSASNLLAISKEVAVSAIVTTSHLAAML
jgi:hypothetical protein